MAYLPTNEIALATNDGQMSISELLTLVERRLSLEADKRNFDLSSVALSSYNRTGWSTAGITVSSVTFNVTLINTDGARISAYYLENGQDWGNGYEVFKVQLQDHGDELLIDFSTQANTVQQSSHTDILNVSVEALTFTSNSTPQRNTSFDNFSIWRYTKDAASTGYVWTQGLNQEGFSYQHGGISVTFTDKDASSGTSSSAIAASADQLGRNYAEINYAFENSNTGFKVAFGAGFDYTAQETHRYVQLMDLEIENSRWRVSLRNGDMTVEIGGPYFAKLSDLGSVIPGLESGATVDQVEGNVDSNLLPAVWAQSNDVLLKPAGSVLIDTGAGDDFIQGSEDADQVRAGPGNDTFMGGAGVDTAVFSGNRADYRWVITASNDIVISDLRPGAPDGVDTLNSVERLKFADTTVSLATPDVLAMLGGSYFTEGYALAAGTGGLLYVVGATNGPVNGSFYSGNTDYFLAQYNTSGQLLWTAIDGSYDLDAKQTPYAGGQDVALAVTVASTGSVFVGGYVNANFHGISNTGAYETKDGFVSLFSASGQRLWSRSFGTTTDDIVYGLASGSAGSVYAVGTTSGQLPGATGRGQDDAFLVKYDASGNRVLLSQWGTSSPDAAYAICTDSAGNLYVAGETGGNLNGKTSHGGQDAFLIKLTAAGVVVWTQVFGTANRETARSVTVDSLGRIYVAGECEGAMPGASSHGNYDAFVTQFAADGTQGWTRLIGSSEFDQAYSVSTSANGTIYVAGLTQGDINGVAKHGTAAESTDAFVVTLDTNGTTLTTRMLGTPEAEALRGLATGSDGKVYGAGASNGALDGEPNAGFAAFLADVTTSVANPSPYAQLEGVSYFWNNKPGQGHALLSNVSVTSTSVKGKTDSDSIVLQNATWDANGHVKTEIWIQTSSDSPVHNFDVDLGLLTSLNAPTLTLAAFPSGFLATNYWNSETHHLKIAGAGNTSLPGGLTKLADLIFDIPATANSVVIDVSTDSVNTVQGAPWTAAMARTNTDANGRYTLGDLMPGLDWTVSSRPATDSGNAITSQDALATLKMAVGINPNTDPDGDGPNAPTPVSAYQLIAADVAGSSGFTPDGRVTAADALAILKMAVGMPAPQAPAGNWVLLPETATLAGITKDAVHWDNTPTLVFPDGGSLTENFVGVLRGDVNGSWQAPAGSTYLEGTDANHLQQLALSLGVPTSQWNVV